ncbi:MAG: twin-arginine translocation signal domain-containing protein [bacterium]|nr:twin-arginine translocation signal domain-containing protein [bacterium]
MMNSGESRRSFLGKLSAAGAALYLGPGMGLARAETHAGLMDMGYKYTISSVDCLPKLKTDMERLVERQKISEHATIQEYVDAFTYELPEEQSWGKSFVIVAIPNKIVQVDFHYKGEKRRVLVAPGYTASGGRWDGIQEHIKEHVIGDKDAKLEYGPFIPQKLLAARSGLGVYGRNNIIYVPEFGSYHALLTYVTDHEFERQPWRNPQMLRECEGCDLCYENCPNKCITAENFVIDAGRCVTLYNEQDADMPDWMDPQAHNALVGCLLCTIECPANLHRIDDLDIMEDITEEETDMILTGAENEALKASIEAKIGRIGLVADFGFLARNLKLLLER